MSRMISLSEGGLLRKLSNIDVRSCFAVHNQNLVRSDYVLSLLLFCSSILTYLIFISLGRVA